MTKKFFFEIFMFLRILGNFHRLAKKFFFEKIFEFFFLTSKPNMVWSTVHKNVYDTTLFTFIEKIEQYSRYLGFGVWTSSRSYPLQIKPDLIYTRVNDMCFFSCIHRIYDWLNDKYETSVIWNTIHFHRLSTHQT